MRTGILAVILAGVVVVAGITYSFIRNRDACVDEALPTAARPGPLSQVVHVDELAKDPGRFAGDIVLQGVVAGVKKSEGVFGVIDSREFESCGSLTCAENILPVKFAGELPEPKSVVQITGRVVRGEKGLLFEAKGVEVMP
ncbi:MAG: hypothetical protein GXP25_23220 [Planctomycetes bacterium]|nr:hypothetical protein [Planctomycetota bacterium]